jgi:hypothetical protein
MLSLGAEAARSVRLASVDPKMLSLGAEAARNLSRIDPKTLSIDAEIVRTLPQIDTSKLLNATSIIKAADVFRPIVAPQISEALKGVGTAQAAAFSANAVKSMRTPTSFSFIKTIEGMNAIQPRLAETIGTLGLPKTFSADVTAALGARSFAGVGDLTPLFTATLADAVALADEDEIVEIVDSATLRLDDMSSAERHKLALDVALMVAAFVMLSAYLSEGAYRNAAGAALAAAAELLSVYWRLTRKLD